MKVLVTGVCGNLGRLLATCLLDSGHDVVGIDRRPWPGRPNALRLFQGDVRKRPAEDVFRTERPDAVVHLATVTHITHQSSDRYRINLGGTQAVFEHCKNYGVRKAVFVGRHTYYGAAPDSPLYHNESAPPLAVQTFPELSDLIAADLYAGSALWRIPELDTAVLRLCYTLGPLRQGTLANFLAGPRVPTVLGFDPLFQFIHERDAASAIALALSKPIRGVFNVCGPDPMPLSVLIRESGRVNVPMPEPLFRVALGRFGFPQLPRGALEHVKYSVVIDGTAFREATGFVHRYDDQATIQAFVSE